MFLFIQIPADKKPILGFADIDIVKNLDCFFCYCQLTESGGIGGGIGVSVEYVEDLERRPNGKVMSIINRIAGHGRGESADAD